MIGKAITADYFLHLYRKYKMSVTTANIYHSSRLEIKGRTTKTLQEIQWMFKNVVNLVKIRNEKGKQ